MNYIILLYYYYTPIENPQQFMADQKLLCQRLNLKGRILINKEGINGTVAGTTEATETYMATMKALPHFENIEFKLGTSATPPFPKLKVKVRTEIITMKSGEQVDIKNTAPYIEPEDMYQLLKEDQEDIVVVDARNEYECKIGKFKNAVTFDIQAFREIPEKALEELEQYREKEIITYCTGGVRCEPFSALLRQHGFKVRQLHGGIVRYAETHPEFGFDGHCYVFDGRVSVKVNDNIISSCEYCGTKTARYINCNNQACHRQFVCCENCDKNHQKLCPDENWLSKLKKLLTNFLRPHENRISS